jgi:hypothetical protein
MRIQNLKIEQRFTERRRFTLDDAELLRDCVEDQIEVEYEVTLRVPKLLARCDVLLEPGEEPFRVGTVYLMACGMDILGLSAESARSVSAWQVVNGNIEITTDRKKLVEIAQTWKEGS